MTLKIVILFFLRYYVPLTNNVIIKLNELTTFIEDKNALKENEIEEIKKIFKEMLKNGENYNVEEIESWLENEGTWNNKQIRNRITNLSHYVQSKFEQTNKFRIISNEKDSCSCDS